HPAPDPRHLRDYRRTGNRAGKHFADDARRSRRTPRGARPETPSPAGDPQRPAGPPPSPPFRLMTQASSLRSRSTRRLVSSQRPPLTPLPTASALLHDLAAPGRLAGWRKAPCLFGPIIPVLSDKNVHIGPPWQAGL